MPSRVLHTAVVGGALALLTALAVAEPAMAPPVIPIEDRPEPRFSASLEPSRAFVPASAELIGAPLGRFQLTYYWVAEQKVATGNTTLRDSACRPIARVRSSFASRLRLEGTGRLTDGRILNVTSRCKCGSVCYSVVNDRGNGWGLGVRNRPLSPFRSIAVDPRRVDIGSWVYVTELDGVYVPGVAPWGGFVHDGCLLADDRGGGVKGRQIDLFTGLRRYYHSLQGQHRLRTVTVHEGGEHCLRHEAAQWSQADDAEFGRRQG